MVLGLVLLFGIGGRIVTMSVSEDQPAATPTPSDSAPTDDVPWTEPASGSTFELRQVLFQESGQTVNDPPRAPGPDAGGPKATERLLRTDCDLRPRPAERDDLLIACDVLGFRYGLGPSELPADAVADAAAVTASDGSWVVQVSLTPDAADAFAQVTGRVSAMQPPLNQLAIVLNGVVVSAPAVQEPIAGGELQVTGQFTQRDAEALASALV